MSESSFVHDEAVDSDLVPPLINGHLDVTQTSSNRFSKLNTGSHLTDSDHSGEEDKKSHSCNQCDYVSKTRSTLVCHVKRVHLGIKDQKCPKCAYTAGISFLLESPHFKTTVNI
jgi:hypothetical protein